MQMHSYIWQEPLIPYILNYYSTTKQSQVFICHLRIQGSVPILLSDLYYVILDVKVLTRKKKCKLAETKWQSEPDAETQ